MAEAVEFSTMNLRCTLRALQSVKKGEVLGAGRGSRTPKTRRSADFESAASASSAIPAEGNRLDLQSSLRHCFCHLHNFPRYLGCSVVKLFDLLIDLKAMMTVAAVYHSNEQVKT